MFVMFEIAVLYITSLSQASKEITYFFYIYRGLNLVQCPVLPILLS